jgi:hypothetical protein
MGDRLDDWIDAYFARKRRFKQSMFRACVDSGAKGGMI